MKIYALPEYNAPPLPNVNPQHNREDYGVEQDFREYLNLHQELLTDDLAAADWHYLPVEWTRYYVYHDCPESPGSLEVRVLDPARTFTICQYAFGPLDCPDESVQFLASRIGDKGIDIPLLCDPHWAPFIRPEKKWLASFRGRLDTHPTLRYDMQKVLGQHKLIDIQEGIAVEERFFVDQLLESYVALAPRGSGCTSFRFYEAMQLGVCPMLIGDIDNRPFKKWIDWDMCSVYCKTVKGAERLLEDTPLKVWRMKGERAARVYREQLAYGKWCWYVLKELEALDGL